MTVVAAFASYLVDSHRRKFPENWSLERRFRQAQNSWDQGFRAKYPGLGFRFRDWGSGTCL